jgi:23S rRNA pseudouridine1911/1915/1917 synthase
MRTDRFLAGALSGLSRRRIQALLGRGEIRLDRRPAKKGELLEPGAEVLVEIEPAALGDIAPEDDPAVSVLWEDEAVVALDKPPGRPSHALHPIDRGTIANVLAARYPETRSASPNPLERGLVHRLDTETSGVLLVGRSRDAWRNLREQFRARTVEKHYLALVQGAIAAPGEIDRRILQRGGGRVRVLPEGASGGQKARTLYRPIASLRGATLLEIELPTGAMHQIRAHLAAIGHPVLGDSRYGGPPAPGAATRLCLHARAIAFRHPRSGAWIQVKSPVPPDLAAAIEALGGERSIAESLPGLAETQRSQGCPGAARL